MNKRRFPIILIQRKIWTITTLNLATAKENVLPVILFSVAVVQL
jgi:hypothetical protein